MPERVLLIGYGNPGRRDDGLGPALAHAIEKEGIPGIAVDADYQLNVEDAATLCNYETVIFADAAVSGAEPFELREIEPRPALSFSSHSVEPEALLALSAELFGKKPKSYVFSIRGYEFDTYEERLSEKASRNLAEAFRFMKDLLGDYAGERGASGI